MPVAERDPLELRLRYTPHDPEPKQHAFHLLDELGILEAFYGGAAGGGKSDTLLAGALRYVHVPRYAALLLRRSYTDLALPGALMDRSKLWLAGSEVGWSEVDFRWTFPSGASLTFGYLKTSNDRYRYASAEFQFVGFDELTEFEEADYRFLFSRLRKPSGLADDDPLANVPLRMRSAGNPGGRGHKWVKRRFIDRLPDPNDPEDTPEKCSARIFVPAKLEDNPHVDQASYEASLASLDRVNRARLRDGDWDVDDGTKVFSGTDVRAARALGEELDELAKRAAAGDPIAAESLPPPVGGELPLGLDWGEHTAGVVGWPLENGGLWVVAGDEVEALEPGAATERLLDLYTALPDWRGRPTVKDPFRLCSEARYDAAGVQSMRTFAKVARRRHPQLRTTAIPFGDYKRETVGYLKHLLERVGEGHRVRVLAISPAAGRLLEQLPELPKNPRDPELWPKRPTADHSADALVALAAPIARRWRSRPPPAAPKPDPVKTVTPKQRP